MKVLIISDLEGVSGVDTFEMCDMQSEAYKRACHLLMQDVNAAVDGAFAGGATEVTVIDGHHCGMNFVKEELHPRAVQMWSRDFTPRTFQAGDFDALMCVGCHAMAGTENGFLDHTQSSAEWFEYTVNGKPYGEIGQQAIWAGSIGVPLVMVCGDQKACDEAKALVPSVATASVKVGKCRNYADCLPLEEAHKRIYDAAADGVRRFREIAPYTIALPATLTLTFMRNDFCDRVAAQSTVSTRNGRTLTKTIDNVVCYKSLTDF